MTCPALWNDQEQILPLLSMMNFQVFEKRYHKRPVLGLFLHLTQRVVRQYKLLRSKSPGTEAQSRVRKWITQEGPFSTPEARRYSVFGSGGLTSCTPGAWQGWKGGEANMAGTAQILLC